MLIILFFEVSILTVHGTDLLKQDMAEYFDGLEHLTDEVFQLYLCEQPGAHAGTRQQQSRLEVLHHSHLSSCFREHLRRESFHLERDFQHVLQRHVEAHSSTRRHVTLITWAHRTCHITLGT